MNKPYLPLAAGDFCPATGAALVAATGAAALAIAWASNSAALLAVVGGSLALGLAYSADLPLLRWKRSPLLAAACILSVRAVLVQLGFFAHMRQALAPGATLVLSRPIAFATAFMLLFSIVIALFKASSPRVHLLPFVHHLLLAAVASCTSPGCHVALSKVHSQGTPCVRLTAAIAAAPVACARAMHGARRFRHALGGRLCHMSLLLAAPAPVPASACCLSRSLSPHLVLYASSPLPWHRTLCRTSQTLLATRAPA